MMTESLVSGEKYKLIVTIVKKGTAGKVVEATSKAGVEGATIFFGKGTADKNIYLDFLGIDYNPEKEIILTLVKQPLAKKALEAICKASNLDKPGKGIGFMVDTQCLAGICHLSDSQSSNHQDHLEETDMDECNVKFDLIVTIVNKGFSEDVVEAAKAAGAEGGTIINGRGKGIHENAKLFGLSIEPEKEIVLTLIDKAKTVQVLSAISDAVELNKPSKGIAFVINVEKTVGICHLLQKDQ